MSALTILDTTTDEHLFAGWFRDRVTWSTWFVFLAALFGLPMTPDQLEVYRRCTGRADPPTAAATEGWLICGRRAGKSFVLALVAVFLAVFREYRPYLAPGERATILIVATDRRQARTIFRYVRALLSVPLIGVKSKDHPGGLIERETADTFDLANRVTIEIGTASYRTTRGLTFAAVLGDELAFWPSDDAADPDYAVLDAIRPGLATIPGAMLLCASSPYAKRGALWDAFKRYFGKDGDVLVWRADTRTMNPTVPQGVIDRAIERDPASAAAEFGAEFRNDIAAFITREVVEAAVSPGVFERSRIAGVSYSAFVDPSGGVSDSMTLAVAHNETGRDGKRVVMLDAVREVKAPFSPDVAVSEFAKLLKSYGVSRVTGDRYSGEWAREAFRKAGIEYRPSALPKSDLYKDLLPRMNSGEIDLLDNSRIVAQLCGLERRTARGGRDSIDHAPGSHDDVANVLAGVVNVLSERNQTPTLRIQPGLIDVRLTRADTPSDAELYAPRPRAAEFVELRNLQTGTVLKFHRSDAREVLARPNTIYEPFNGGSAA